MFQTSIKLHLVSNNLHITHLSLPFYRIYSEVNSPSSEEMNWPKGDTACLECFTKVAPTLRSLELLYGVEQVDFSMLKLCKHLETLKLNQTVWHQEVLEAIVDNLPDSIQTLNLHMALENLIQFLSVPGGGESKLDHAPFKELRSLRIDDVGPESNLQRRATFERECKERGIKLTTVCKLVDTPRPRADFFS